ncbi:hypothetical protein, partial [Novosphingobium beihaiensis]
VKATRLTTASFVQQNLATAQIYTQVSDSSLQSTLANANTLERAATPCPEDPPRLRAGSLRNCSLFKT